MFPINWNDWFLNLIYLEEIERDFSQDQQAADRTETDNFIDWLVNHPPIPCKRMVK